MERGESANRVHQWCILLYHVNLKGAELYFVKPWVKVITKVSHYSYFPIKNPLIKMSIIQKFHRKRENRCILHRYQPFAKISMNSKHKAMNLMIIILVALVLDMSRTCPGLVPTVPVFGKNTVFMGTQDRLQNFIHGSFTCPSCPATRLCQSWTKNKRASHGPKITVADQK